MISRTKSLFITAVLLVAAFVLLREGHLIRVFEKIVLRVDPCMDIFHYGHHERDVWMTHGCQLHNYSMTDVGKCMARKRFHMGPMHIAFVGDSRVRETFFQLVSYFDPTIKAEKVHEDLSFKFSNVVTLEYFFKVFTNESQAVVYDKWFKNAVGNGRPELVIVGVAAWMICHYDKGKPREVALERYKREFAQIILPRLKKLESMGTKVLWKLQDPVVTYRMYEPQKLCPLTNDQFNAYNEAAENILNGTEITVWHTSRAISLRWVKDQRDGLHYYEKKTCHLSHVFEKKVLGVTPCLDIFHYGHHERDVWVSHGCQLHNFSMTDVRTCMALKRDHAGPVHIAFVGDSRVRETFYQLVSYFDPKVEPSKKLLDGIKFQYSNDVTLEYVFQKWTNDSQAAVYKNWFKHDVGNGRPELVIGGVAAWMICFYDEGKSREVAFKRYKREFRKLILPHLKKLESMGTKVVWKLQQPVVTSRMLDKQKLCPLTNDQFNDYNMAAENILNGSEITVWRASRSISNHWIHQLGDGLHHAENKTCEDQHVSLLLNYMCNRFMDFKSHVCCSKV